MNISQKTITTLEFDKILKMLAEAAPTEGSAAAALNLRPTDDFVVVTRRQTRTTDAKRLMSIKGMPPFGSVPDISDAVGRAEKGSSLNARELMDISSVLHSARLCLDYIKTDKLFDTTLDEIFMRLTPERMLEEKINRTIIAEDMVADEASPELADIRRRMRATANKVKDILQKYTSGGTYSKALQENIVTIRNGRYVIPVKAEYKNEVKGLVHDTSSSGATLFIEPMAVVEANNALRELEGREAAEIERIFAELSADAANVSGIILSDFYNLNELALAFACANLSFNMKGEMPHLTKTRTVSLLTARHPLLDREKVVPINVDMSDGFDTLVITGPNTGGKTVTLKLIGLMALMAQSGLHIPAGDRSTIGVFSEILADIGDEQSIEQSLSTFSAHMVNIVGILNSVGAHSLVLFDELGAGTDPIEGAALAMAILEAVREKGALTAATTHYAELKAYAIETEGVCNASCEFDIETLKPTYRLIMGTPGKSNAFEIAGKLGIDGEIIERAKSLVNNDNRKFENVIERLEEKRIDAERDKEILARERAEYEAFKRESEEKLKKALDVAEHEAEKARERAQSLIEGARASAEFSLSMIEKLRKKNAADITKSDLDAARKAFREHLSAAEKKYNPISDDTDDGYVLPRPLVKGDRVIIRSIGKEGVLVDNPDRDGGVRVQAGKIISKTNISNLKLAPALTAKSAKKIESHVNVKVDKSFYPELDLRGQLSDDAWYACDKYLDDALVAGIKSVRIIHGKGTGALRNSLWLRFKSDGRIASFRLGAYGEGDAGVTVIELK